MTIACTRCGKKLSRKSARLINGVVQCGVCMWKPASVDTRPQGGDVKQAPFTGGAVGSEADETPKESHP